MLSHQIFICLLIIPIKTEMNTYCTIKKAFTAGIWALATSLLKDR